MRNLPNEIYWKIVALRNLPGQRPIPYFSLKEPYELPDTRLASIVEYAVKTVAYYRNLFGTMKTNPSEIQSIEDLWGFPLDSTLSRTCERRFS